jgi:hypothetical protein
VTEWNGGADPLRTGLQENAERERMCLSCHGGAVKVLKHPSGTMDLFKNGSSTKNNVGEVVELPRLFW